MQTIIGKDLFAAKKLLETDELVAIPTETVYGLAANALHEDAVLKIFAAKKRPFFDPLIVHTHSVEEIKKYTDELPESGRLLLEAFAPGPVTLLLKKKKKIPDLVTSGLDTVGIRIPSHPLTLELLRMLDFPLAAPSANPFGYISPTTAEHVFNQLNNQIPYIIDGGPTTVGIESTIVGFEEEQPVVYRLGGLSINEIERVAGKVRLEINDSSNPRAPGTLKSHYAPRTPLLFITDSAEVVKYMTPNTATISLSKLNGLPEGVTQYLLSNNGNLEDAARNLFAIMRNADSRGFDRIIAVEVPNEGLGLAINDRLKRASVR